MKIGILTLPLQDNFGGILQASALYRVLQDMGHMPVLLGKKFWRPMSHQLLGSILRNLPGHDLGGVRSNAKARERHAPFINQTIPNQTGPIYSRDALAKEVKRLGLGAVIVGSDQVWRPDYIEDIDTGSFFLDFQGDFRKIAYAASFGKSEWTAPHRLADVRRMLADFDAVSLRESSGATLCQTVLERANCVQALDPTLLVDRAFYTEIMAPQTTSAPYLLNYALDGLPLTQPLLDRVSAGPAKGCAVKTLTLDDGNDVPHWVRAFHDASYVVTDSFHGTVFAILFQKPFICIANQERGVDRFTSLLSLFGLENRLVRSPSDLSAVEAEIDFAAVAPRLAEQRAISASFLDDALAGAPAHA